MSLDKCMYHVYIIENECESHSVMSNSLWSHGLFIVHGILQAWILEWIAVPFSRGSSQPRDQAQVSCIADRFFSSWATREARVYHCTGIYHTRASQVAQCKESTCQWRRCPFNPWVRKILWRRKQQPSPVFFPLESHGQRSLEGYSPWGHKSRTWLNN